MRASAGKLTSECGAGGAGGSGAVPAGAKTACTAVLLLAQLCRQPARYRRAPTASHLATLTACCVPVRYAVCRAIASSARGVHSDRTHVLGASDFFAFD